MGTARRPNILFITTDQQRGDCYGFAGRKVHTPHLDRLASQGTTLRKTICASPVCQPSRASILTGLMPDSHGVRDNGIDLPPQTGAAGFAGRLSDAGYNTAFIGKAHFASKRTLEPTGSPECRHSSKEYPEDWSGPYMGFQRAELMVNGSMHRERPPTRPPEGQQFERFLFNEANGPDVYETWKTERPEEPDTPKTWHSNLPPAWHSSSWVGDRTVDFISHQDPETPFAIWASFCDPHYAFDCPMPWSLLHSADDVDISPTHQRDLDKRPWYHRASLEGKPQSSDPNEVAWRTKGSRMEELSDDQLRKMTANYYGMISLVDHNVGRMLIALADRGQLDNTIVIFSSDHGDLLGDHGLYLKGPTLYEGLMNVGAIVAGPGVVKGRTTSAPTSLLDIAPTICDFGGLGEQSDMQGRSLRGLLEGGDEDDERVVYSSWHLLPYRTGIELDLRVVHTGDEKLIFDTISGAGEYYDLRTDPQEMENLFDVAERAGDVARLRSLLEGMPGPDSPTIIEPVAPGGS